MKTTILQLIVVFFTTTLISSCGVDIFNRIDGNRHVVRENRKLNDNFTAVKVSTGIDLYITQGNNVSLSVEADENLHDIIKTEVEDGELKIYSEKNIWRAKARKVHLTIRTLNELKATSGSDIYTENTIKTDNFKINVSSGADARITVIAENLTSSANSGAGLRISGKTISHTSRATSGSSIRAYALKSETTTVKASSGANIDVYASKEIDAKASSGGDIDYRGNPKRINKKTSSGGSVSKH
ncbi:MAG: DUF2807 domain-containing protein [Polaribacter sp.]|nr:DUF2807 domain-containing protein [Polaribacter sp.]